jgi:hypothetical protein
MTSPATAARDYASLGNNNPVFSKLSTGLQQQQPDFPQQKSKHQDLLFTCPASGFYYVYFNLC